MGGQMEKCLKKDKHLILRPCVSLNMKMDAYGRPLKTAEVVVL